MDKKRDERNDKKDASKGINMRNTVGSGWVLFVEICAPFLYVFIEFLLCVIFHIYKCNHHH